MADKTTTTVDLVMVGAFRDGDDRTINLPNPKYDYTDETSMTQAGTDIKALGTFIKTKGLLIGDKASAEFSRFKSAKIRRQIVTVLDLSA